MRPSGGAVTGRDNSFTRVCTVCWFSRLFERERSVRRLSVDEWQTWLGQNGYECTSSGLSIARPSRQILDRLPHRTTPNDFALFIASLAELGGFEGQRMLWIADWTIWASISGDGLRHLSMLTGCPLRDVDAPDFHCYLFSQSEWESVKPVISLPIIYGWDAYLLTEGAQSLTEISHDEYVSFYVAEDSMIDGAYLESVARWRYDQ